jgi:hypothetical protein
MAYSSTEVHATDFAITTVNVPDRLDLRDMDDRKQLEEGSRRRSLDMSAFSAWAPRLIVVGILTALAFFLFEGVDTLRTALSAPQLSQRLSVSMGVPIEIDASNIALSPSPRLVLTKVTFDHELTVEQVSFNLGTRHIGQILSGHGWNWGEAVVGPTSLSLEQCQYLLNLIPRLDTALPHSLSGVRFTGLSISDQPWLAGNWEVSVARDGAHDAFSGASARLLTDKGAVEISLHPTSNPDVASFQLNATNWALPFLSGFAVEAAVAGGQVSSTQLAISQYQVAGPFGAVKGDVSATFDGVWSIAGTAASEGLDIDALLKQIAPRAAAADDTPADSDALFQGMASFKGQFQGKGKSINEAVSNSVFETPVDIRWPVLNGINLGYAATKPGATAGSGAGGGSTRFTSMDATIVATASQFSLRDIRARAGALSAFGQVNMSANHDLSGLLHVDLGETRVLAPIRVLVKGSVTRPQFGR